MTLLDQLRILRIPIAIKALLALFALGMIALNVYVIYNGLQDQRYDFWIAAGASLLAAGAPALAVIVALLITESGMSALKRHIQRMLAAEIPRELRFTFEAPSPTLEEQCKPGKLAYRPNRARVACGMYREELWANYELSGRAVDGRQQLLRMRVELVMRRVNINILFAKKLIAERLELPANAPLEALGGAFQRRFVHTISGATGAGYQFNPLPMMRVLNEREDIAFVATRELASEFVWDPAARLEFIQDLVLMMRSFVTECPDIFDPVAKPREMAA